MPSLSSVVFSILLLLLGTYAVFTIVLWFYWQKLPQMPKALQRPATKTTVIVPVRNEANRIGSLLKDLSHQTYDNGLFEVIVADDGSTDNTPYVLEAFKKTLHLI